MLRDSRGPAADLRQHVVAVDGAEAEAVAEVAEAQACQLEHARQEVGDLRSDMSAIQTSKKCSKHPNFKQTSQHALSRYVEKKLHAESRQCRERRPLDGYVRKYVSQKADEAGK